MSTGKEGNKVNTQTQTKTEQGNLYNLELDHNKNSTVESRQPLCSEKQIYVYIYTFILNTIVLIIKKCHYKIRLRETVLVQNTLKSVESTLAAEVHLAGE
jgi:hypothetical protein